MGNFVSVDQGLYPRTIITRLANMSLTAPGFLEQRFHLGAKLDPDGFAENKRARFVLCGDDPYLMLSVFPKDIDFELRVTTSDHFAPERGRDGLVALALVAYDHVTEQVSKLYFSYFPQLFRHQVFMDEGEARKWLFAQRAEAERSKDRSN